MIPKINTIMMFQTLGDSSTAVIVTSYPTIALTIPTAILNTGSTTAHITGII
jgi:hypothetical protein